MSSKNSNNKQEKNKKSINRTLRQRFSDSWETVVHNETKFGENDIGPSSKVLYTSSLLLCLFAVLPIGYRNPAFYVGSYNTVVSGVVIVVTITTLVLQNATNFYDTEISAASNYKDAVEDYMDVTFLFVASWCFYLVSSGSVLVIENLVATFMSDLSIKLISFTLDIIVDITGCTSLLCLIEKALWILVYSIPSFSLSVSLLFTYTCVREFFNIVYYSLDLINKSKENSSKK